MYAQILVTVHVLITSIKTKNLSISEQLKLLKNHKILPLNLRRLYRFISFLHSTLSKNRNNEISINISNQLVTRTLRNSYTLPKCNNNAMKYSFLFISLKILNILSTNWLLLNKKTLKSFILKNILSFYEKSFEFFT